MTVVERGSDDDVTSDIEVVDDSTGHLLRSVRETSIASQIKITTREWKQVWFQTSPFNSYCTYFHGKIGFTWISGPNTGKPVIWDKLESCSWNGCHGPFDLSKYPHQLKKKAILTHGFTDFCNGENSRDGKHDRVYSILHFTLGNQRIVMRRHSSKCGPW